MMRGEKRGERRREGAEMRKRERGGRLEIRGKELESERMEEQ